jgi:hypothetical protein
MSKEAKKSYGSMLLLFALGALALFAGKAWLPILIPAGLLVYYGARPLLRSGRN